MSRATYIYLVYRAGHTTVLSANTVKYEAHEWVRRSEHKFKDCLLMRMRDGCRGGESRAKDVTLVDWELEDGDE